MTVVNAGQARFTGKVTVKDVDVTFTRPSFWDNCTFEVTGTHALTITDGYFGHPCEANINTSGDVVISTTNVWGEGNASNSAITFGDKTKKVTFDKNVFHNTQANGVVKFNGGSELLLQRNNFVDMNAAHNPFVFAASIPTIKITSTFVTYTNTDVVDSTALCRFQKTKDTAVKEFDKTTISFDTKSKANNQVYGQETSGLQTAFVVFSNKNNKVTSDNPTVEWV